MSDVEISSILEKELLLELLDLGFDDDNSFLNDSDELLSSFP